MRTLISTLVLLTISTAVVAAPEKGKGGAGPDWKLTGWEITSCCCNDICPCRVNEKPTHMECEGIISIHIDKGYVGSTDMKGVNLVMTSRGFDEKNGGWNKLYVDKRATPAQQKAIGQLLSSMASSYKPEVAGRIFGKESRGMKVVSMTFKKSKDGLMREADVPGVCHVKARLGKVPNSKEPTHILGVLTEFSPIFYPAAGVDAKVTTSEVPFDHPDLHRAEVEDFTLTRADYATRKIGFQAYTGKGGCLLPGK
jgi:hypothetical protein